MPPSPRRTADLIALAALPALAAFLASTPALTSAVEPPASERVAMSSGASLAVAARKYRPGTVPGTNCPLFPKRNSWRTPVDKLAVHRRSAQWLANIGTSGRLHPDFGPSFGELPVPYGIGVTVVPKRHPKVRVAFEYADESDRVRYPLGRDTFIEGGWDASGDRHAIVVERGTCRLYETYATYRTPAGWQAGSGATWNLRSNRLRPLGWTSADAAGLPILPGLLSYEEVKAGRVSHAIRFTVPVTQDAFVWPARHRAGATDDPAFPPMGARFRMTRSYDTSGYSRSARVVLRAMKRYGLVVADNGAAWYFQGTADPRWPIRLVDELKRIPASAFEAVDTAPMRIRTSSGRARR